MNVWLLHGHAIVVRRLFHAKAGYGASRLREAANVLVFIALFLKLLFLLFKGLEYAHRASLLTGGRIAFVLVVFFIRSPFLGF